MKEAISKEEAEEVKKQLSKRLAPRLSSSSFRY